jgi:hypothetical protein
MKFDISIFFENLSGRFLSLPNMTRITGTLHEDRCTFLIISGSFLLIMKNKIKVVEKIKTHILFLVTVFLRGARWLSG